MIINHISILEMAQSSRRRECDINGQYVMRVNLAYSPENLWKLYFALQWRRMAIIHRRRIKMDNNELRLVLCKNDNIQNYIDSIKRLVSRTDNLVAHYQEIKKSNNIKRFRIKNM